MIIGIIIGSVALILYGFLINELIHEIVKDIRKH